MLETSRVLLRPGRHPPAELKLDADEEAGLSLIHAVLIDVSRHWRGIKISPDDLEKLDDLRAEVAPLAASA